MRKSACSNMKLTNFWRERMNEKRENIRSYFDEMNFGRSRFLEEDPILKYEQEMRQRAVLDLLDFSTPKKILDVGCGTGNISLKFLERGFFVNGVDISVEMINSINAEDLKKMNVVCSNIDDYLKKSNEKYDVVACSSVLHHLPDYLKTFQNMVKMVEKGGLIYITHEPLPKNYRRENFLTKIFNFFDNFLFKAWLSVRGIQVLNLNYIYSDFHCEEGIEIDSMIEILEKNNFKKISYKTHYLRKINFLCLLRDFLNVDEIHFRLIYEKER